MTICKDTEMIRDSACRSLVQNPLRFSSSFCLLPGRYQGRLTKFVRSKSTSLQQRRIEV